MNTTRTPVRPFLGALLAAAVLAAAATAAPPDSSKGTLLPGAKLMHKFSKEVYRAPVWVMTDKGPRLEVWFDAFDPEPPQRISGIPNPDPRIDLLIWDPIANKELHRLAYPRDSIPYPSTYSNFSWSGWMAMSPDGKRVAVRTVNYQPPRRGGVYGDFTTRVRLMDLENHKAQLVAEHKEEKVGGAVEVYVLFAPDGSLVTLRGSTCTVREPGKDKPRATFEVTRAADYKTKSAWFMIQQVAVSPDGSQLAVAADGAIVVYDLATGKKLFEPARAAPEPKKSGDPMSGAMSLAYAPAGSEPKLLAVEWVVEPQGPQGPQKGGPLGAGPQKQYILTRLFDLKAMKEVGSWKAEGHPSPVSAYYTAKGEPCVLYDGKVVDGASGKELYSFDPGAGAAVSADGKALVRVTKKRKEDKTMTVEVWSLDNDK
jgi:hypothetical protein